MRAPIASPASARNSGLTPPVGCCVAKTAHMRGSLTARRHVTAGLLAATLLFAACGGGDDGGDASGDALPRVDLVGAHVLPTSEFDANQLPNVVVNDINTGRGVNFRILIPQEKPILLWMWAPQ
jgi:hypothetical protein